MTTTTLIREKHLNGVAYVFRGSGHYQHGTHGVIWADMILEKELRVLHLGMEATGSGLRHWAWLERI